MNLDEILGGGVYRRARHLKVGDVILNGERITALSVEGRDVTIRHFYDGDHMERQWTVHRNHEVLVWPGEDT